MLKDLESDNRSNSYGNASVEDDVNVGANGALTGELEDGELEEAASAGAVHDKKFTEGRHVGDKSAIVETQLTGPKSTATLNSQPSPAHPEKVTGEQQQGWPKVPNAVINGGKSSN